MEKSSERALPAMNIVSFFLIFPFFWPVLIVAGSVGSFIGRVDPVLGFIIGAVLFFSGRFWWGDVLVPLAGRNRFVAAGVSSALFFGSWATMATYFGWGLGILTPVGWVVVITVCSLACWGMFGGLELAKSALSGLGGGVESLAVFGRKAALALGVVAAASVGGVGAAYVATEQMFGSNRSKEAKATPAERSGIQAEKPNGGGTRDGTARAAEKKVAERRPARAVGNGQKTGESLACTPKAPLANLSWRKAADYWLAADGLSGSGESEIEVQPGICLRKTAQKRAGCVSYAIVGQTVASSTIDICEERRSIDRAAALALLRGRPHQAEFRGTLVSVSVEERPADVCPTVTVREIGTGAGQSYAHCFVM